MTVAGAWNAACLSLKRKIFDRRISRKGHEMKKCWIYLIWNTLAERLSSFVRVPWLMGQFVIMLVSSREPFVWTQRVSFILIMSENKWSILQIQPDSSFIGLKNKKRAENDGRKEVPGEGLLMKGKHRRRLNMLLLSLSVPFFFSLRLFSSSACLPTACISGGLWETWDEADVCSFASYFLVCLLNL